MKIRWITELKVQLYFLIAVWPWLSDLTILGLNFFTGKTEIMSGQEDKIKPWMMKKWLLLVPVW